MHRTVLSTALSIALAACVLGPAPAYATAGVTQAAAEDTPAATPRGTTFVLPEGWTQRVEGNAVFLMPPEANGGRMAIIDASGKDADAVVAEAWKAMGITPKFMVATDAAPSDGWDQRRFYDYDIPANAKRVINASAFRKGKAWTVVVADVDQAIAEKRGSQYGKIAQRFQPAGYSRETFAGRAAHKLDAAGLPALC